MIPEMHPLEVIGLALMAMGAGFAIMAAVMYVICLLDGDDEN
jgi:hypothetical protein